MEYPLPITQVVPLAPAPISYPSPGILCHWAKRAMLLKQIKTIAIAFFMLKGFKQTPGFYGVLIFVINGIVDVT
jgi:hypothetical protein